MKPGAGGAHTWCGPGEGVAGAWEVLTLFLAELQSLLGMKRLFLLHLLLLLLLELIYPTPTELSDRNLN